jgi:putative ABC transport system permease protein
MGFRQFRSRPLQSLLIVVAIALGVAVVTAVVAYMQLSNRQAQLAKNSSDARTLILSSKQNDFSNLVSANPAPVRKVGTSQDKTVTFTLEDIRAAKMAAPSIDYGYPSLWTNYIETANGEGFGVEPMTQEHFEAAMLTVTKGATFTQSDFDENRAVMLITPTGAKNNDLPEDPIGKTLSVEGREQTIIGLLPENEESYLPDGLTLYKPSDSETFEQLLFVVKDASNLEQAQSELETFARRTWGESVVVQSFNLDWLEQSQRLATFFTAIFASLGLLIASLNIMNLFIARVLRRQKEFAILRSLGAQRGDIRNKLLSEALALGVVGGILGVIAGYGLLLAFNSYVQRASGGNWLDVSFSPSALLIGFALAIIVSLLFSFYPALMASRVKIREALGGE